jgi:methyl-accepting chemotaxis protein
MNNILAKFKKMSLKVKLVSLFLVSILILISLVLLTFRFFITQEFVRERVTTDLKTGYQIFDREYPGDWKLEGDKLYKGDTLMNKNFEVIDFIGNLTDNTVTIFAEDTRVATNVKVEGKRAVGTTISDEVGQVVLEEGKDYYGKANVVGSMYQTAYTPLKNADGEIIGSWYTGVPQEAGDQLIRSIFIKVLGIVVVVTALLSAVIYVVSDKIVNPILKVVDFVNQIAEGDLNVEIDVDSESEIGELVDGVHKMKNKIREMIVQIRDSVENMSAYSEELSASAQEGNASIETTSGLIQDMSAGIEEISASAQEVASFSQEANAKTTRGSQNIEETVDSIQEINTTVQETVEVINELDQNSEEIGQIVEMITNIAEQTNLLALNAAIEAARAGEHGQGFAVVADEIRELATETAQATDEISSLVNQTQQKSKQGIKKVKKVEAEAKEGQQVAEKTQEVFKEIKKDVDGTANQIEQTARATDDLAENSDEIITATEDISSMSNEVTNSSEELAEMAQKLEELVDQFNI